MVPTGSRSGKNHFDLVIADCNMPVMSGYELARSIRRDESEQQRPPCTLLGFTANAQPEENNAARTLGWMTACSSPSA